MRLFKNGFFLLAAGLALVGCQASSDLPSDLERLGRANAPPLPPQTASVAQQPTPGAMPVVHRGVVAEVLDVPHYTYLRLDTADTKALWAAIPSSAVKVGQSVEIIQSLIMSDFHSKTLNRTFPSIVFGVLPGTGQKTDAPETVPPAGATFENSGMALPPGHPPVPAGTQGKD